jgi:putative transposase
LGAESGIFKSEVSRICAELDTDPAAFNARLGRASLPLRVPGRDVLQGAGQRRQTGKGARVVSQAVVIATGMSADGRREVLGCAVEDSETQDFWTQLLRSQRDRGLGGTQLVISDHHRGLMNAINANVAGAAWQRYRVHGADVRIMPMSRRKSSAVNGSAWSTSA